MSDATKVQRGRDPQHIENDNVRLLAENARLRAAAEDFLYAWRDLAVERPRALTEYADALEDAIKRA
jgi:hypothetical protein